MQSIKEAAPLLKFTMHKQALQIEHQNVQDLLQLAELIRAKLVIISRTRAQYLVHADSSDVLRTVSSIDLYRFFKSPSKASAVHLDRMMEMKMCHAWDRYDGVLMEGSALSGMYVYRGQVIFSTSRQLQPSFASCMNTGTSPSRVGFPWQ
jgi:hypothetical protein